MIIAFFGEVGTIFQPTLASERELMKEEVRKLSAYQGTFMGSALEYTHDFVTSLSYTKNEVILISDGLPYGEQASPAAIAVEKLANSNVLVSTIQVVTETPTSVNLMKQLASIGKGYYYHIKDLKEVESLVLNEVLNSNPQKEPIDAKVNVGPKPQVQAQAPQKPQAQPKPQALEDEEFDYSDFEK